MHRSNADSYAPRSGANRYRQIVPLLAIVCLSLSPRPAFSQSASDASQETMRLLTERIERLEKRLAEVEAKQSGSISGANDHAGPAVASVAQMPVAEEQLPLTPATDLQNGRTGIQQVCFAVGLYRATIASP